MREEDRGVYVLDGSLTRFETRSNAYMRYGTFDTRFPTENQSVHRSR